MWRKVSIQSSMIYKIMMVFLVSMSATLLSTWMFTPAVLTQLISPIQRRINNLENSQHSKYRSSLFVDEIPFRNYNKNSASPGKKVLPNRSTQRFLINTPRPGPARLIPPSTSHKNNAVKTPKAPERELAQHYFSTVDYHTKIKNITGVTLPVNLIYFMPALNLSLVHLARKTFFAATKLLSRLHVPYILTQGSLVGSYLHHNMIPWDDDLDVLVDEKHQNTLKAAFANETVTIDGVKLKIRIGGNQIWKIYLDMNRTSASFTNPVWPFLDMFPYKDNGTHLVQNVRPCHAFPKKRMYPVQRRPFEGSLQPVPCDMEHVLRHILFNPKFDEVCKSRGYNHLTRKAAPHKAVPCVELLKFYPFVSRTSSPFSPFVFEALIANKTELGKYAFDIPVCDHKTLKRPKILKNPKILKPSNNI